MRVQEVKAKGLNPLSLWLFTPESFIRKPLVRLVTWSLFEIAMMLVRSASGCGRWTGD